MKNTQNIRRITAAAAAFVLVACAAVVALTVKKPNDSTVPATSGSSLEETVKEQSYEDIFNAINAYNTKNSFDGGVVTFGGDVTMEAAAEDAVEAPAAAEPSTATTTRPSSEIKSYNAASDDAENAPDHTGTNVQVEGIDEADVVKTDGKYIYTMRGGKMLTIASADGGKLALLSETDILEGKDSFYFSDMFINGDKLIVIGSSYRLFVCKVFNDEEANEVEEYRDVTEVNIYDISDRSAPKLINTLTQDGNYHTARMTGNNIYVISDYYIYNAIDQNDPSTFVPCRGSSDGQAVPLLASEILIAGGESSAYTVIGSVNLDATADYADTKSVLGASSALYCGSDVMVLACTDYQSATEETVIDGKNATVITSSNNTNLVRLFLENGKIVLGSSALVKGTPLNQFSLDVYNDVLRIVTTDTTSVETIYTDGIDTYDYSDSTTNALYTLDKNMNLLGSITDLAPDERVYSVRFSGDTGYFVTFRQIDPLFAVDLSDPSDPTVLSALKIPGFSSYLHPYSEGRLFGFGNDADEESGRMGNLKLAMFDTSDPANVTERFKLIMDDGCWSPASYDHKAIFVNSKYSMVAFQVDNDYVIYSYDDQKGFAELARFRAAENELYPSFCRAFVIGDCFYLCSDVSVSSYSLSDLSKIDGLVYPEIRYEEVEYATEEYIVDDAE